MPRGPGVESRAVSRTAWGGFGIRRVTDLAANAVRDRRTSWWSNARGQMAPVDRTTNTTEASARCYLSSRNLRPSRPLVGPPEESSRDLVLTACRPRNLHERRCRAGIRGEAGYPVPSKASQSAAIQPISGCRSDLDSTSHAAPPRQFAYPEISRSVQDWNRTTGSCATLHPLGPLAAKSLAPPARLPLVRRP